MKKYFLLVLLCVTINNTAFSQLAPVLKSVKFQVGKQPIAIFPTKLNNSFNIDTTEVNIICLGQDVNYNGVFDDGDELPSWWKIKNVQYANPWYEGTEVATVHKVMDLAADWSIFPYRYRISEEIDKVPALHANLLPLPYPDRVVYYDMTTEEQKGHAIVDENIKSTCFYSNFAFSTRRIYENPGDWEAKGNVLTMYKAHDFAHILSYESPNSTIQRVIAYTNMDGTTPTIAVLYEGSGFPANSVVELHTAKIPLADMTANMTWTDCFDIKTIEVGKGANDMNFLNIKGLPFLFVVSSFDNRIYTIDCSIQEVNGFAIGIVDSYIQVPADAPSSIREVSFLNTNNDIISATVTGYDGNLYYKNNILPNLIEDTPWHIHQLIPAVPETSFLFNDLFDYYGSKHKLISAHTLIYADEYYTAGNDVELLYLDGWVGINEENNISKIYPNPAENRIVNIELENMSDITSINLIDNAGKNIQAINDYNVDGNNIQINLHNLQTGNYFIKVDMKQGVRTHKIIVK